MSPFLLAVYACATMTRAAKAPDNPDTLDSEHY